MEEYTMIIKKGTKIKENLMGIYAIIGIREGKADAYYIGQAGLNGIAKRNSYHMSMIRYNKHKYQELNEIYKQNPDNIRFEILEIVEDENLLPELEEFYMNYFKHVDGVEVINKSKTTTSQPKRKNTELMKIAQLGSNNGNCSKLDETKVCEINWLKANPNVHQMSTEEIADHYNISVGYYHRVGCDRWLSVGNKMIIPSWIN
jgi:hypothetical protein